jgi:hypothetical protein
MRDGSDLADASNSILARLTAQVGGSVIRAANAVATAGPIPAGLVKMGYVAHLPIIRVQIADNTPEVSRYLTGKFIDDQPTLNLAIRLKSDDIEDAFEAKLRKAGGEKTKFTAYIAFNEKALADALEAADQEAVKGSMKVATDRTAGLKQNQWTVKQLNRSDGLIYRHPRLNTLEMFDGGRVKDQFGKEVQGKLPAAASIVVGLLQVALQIKGSGELDKIIASGDKARAGEAQLSFTALSFGTVSAMGSAMDGMAELNPKFARFSPQLFNKEKFWLKFGAKGFGFAGGCIATYLDSVNAWKSLQNEQYGMMGMYIVSAGISLAGAGLIGLSIFYPELAASLAVTGWGIVLLVLGLVFTLLIGIIKDNDLQNWLGKCLFGTDNVDKYKTLDDELRALKAMQP